ncbi:conserved hypothetical protein [Pyrenophora tritici-repentis Pt-1C-BFP]|uniref:Uncharacterized protein n=1 Tax=Pyrenophora tritici-repentis (strain Pt-1C-BFP) TaxID=426418 RepID=B2W1M5_PYRTR|nr:uncharacterized protein PTRG_04360 [Pyrenophora tritici-repentis Pt-1C-BFP]EDU47198.1 conserved hypothetical protein [Pyrenophora tritici-repentis Pt-1C-BFP]
MAVISVTASYCRAARDCSDRLRTGHRCRRSIRPRPSRRLEQQDHPIHPPDPHQENQHFRSHARYSVATPLQVHRQQHRNPTHWLSCGT